MFDESFLPTDSHHPALNFALPILTRVLSRHSSVHIKKKFNMADYNSINSYLGLNFAVQTFVPRFVPLLCIRFVAVIIPYSSLVNLFRLLTIKKGTPKI